MDTQNAEYANIRAADRESVLDYRSSLDLQAMLAELTRLRQVEKEAVRMYDHMIGCDMCDNTACMEDPQQHPATIYPAIAAAAHAQAGQEVQG
jgi:hypothetical protein